MKISYYINHKPANARNAHVVPILLLDRWYGVPSPSKIHFEIEHYQKGSEFRIATAYSKLLLCHIDEARRSPYRMGRLSLEGKSPDGSDLFALWDVNLDSLVGGTIFFSPVPFRPDGKPKLPYEGEELKKFLLVVKYLLCDYAAGTACPDNLDGLVLTVQAAMRLNEDQFTYSNAVSMLHKMLGAGIVEGEWQGQLKTTMTSQDFERIFGVKLPQVGEIKQTNKQDLPTDLHPLCVVAVLNLAAWRKEWDWVAFKGELSKLFGRDLTSDEASQIIVKLKSMGLVEVAPYSGVYRTLMSREQVEEKFNIQWPIEPRQ